MRLPRVLAVPIVALPLSCASNAAPVPHAPSRVVNATDTPRDASRSTRAITDADVIAREQLATEGQDARFSTDRQIAALTRAILLYRQFLERAGDDPHYAEAVKRSRDRIADAEATLSFLRETPAAAE